MTAPPPPGRPRRSLARELRLGLALFSLLAVAALASPLAVLAHRSRRAEVEALQQERARSAALELDAYVEDLQRKLGFLARMRGFTTLPAETQRDLLEALIRHNTAYETVAILDRTGQVTLALSPFGPPLRPWDTTAPFRAAFGEGEEFVGPVELEAGRHNMPHLTMAVPVRDPSDRIDGVLLARVDLRFLWAIISESEIGATGYSYVVDHRDRVVAEQGLSPEGFAPVFVGDRRFLRRLRAGTGPAVYRGLREVEVLGGLAPVRSAGWEVVVELPIEEAYAPLRRMLAAMALTLPFMGLVVFGLGLFFSRRIVRPLERLTATAARLGKGDLEARVQVRGDDELAILGTAFNSMAEQLRDQLADTRFLADAGAALGESLDFHATLATVARLAVPRLGDWCVVDLLEEDGRIRRVAYVHADASKEPLLRQLIERYPPFPASPQPTARVLRTGELVLVPELREEELHAFALDPAHERLIQQLGTRSICAVPFRARGTIVGAMSFASAVPGRYRPVDVALLEELARRAALAVDNARLHEEAHRAIRARDLFLSIAAHELKTPVAALALQVETILRAARGPAGGLLPPDRLAQKLETAERQARRLVQLINQLLDVSRAGTGRFELEPTEFDLAEAVRETAGRLQPELARAGVGLRLEAEERVCGSWDRLRIEQVVNNLLTNALRYGGGGPIEVTVDTVVDRARLSVRDHGKGIKQEDQARIFGLYERATTERASHGLGLGLFIARQIVLAHGGSIRVESKVGEGSTFTVELPWSGCAEEEPPGAGAGPPGPGGPPAPEPGVGAG